MGHHRRGYRLRLLLNQCLAWQARIFGAFHCVSTFTMHTSVPPFFPFGFALCHVLSASSSLHHKQEAVSQISGASKHPESLKHPSSAWLLSSDATLIHEENSKATSDVALENAKHCPPFFFGECDASITCRRARWALPGISCISGQMRSQFLISS